MADGAGDGLGEVVGVALGWGVEEEVGVGEAVGSGVGAGESRLPQAAKAMVSKKAGRLATIVAETEIRKGMGRFIGGVFLPGRI